MGNKFDVDIDVPPHTEKGKYGIRAIQYIEEAKEIRPHPSGYYIDDDVPVDFITGFAAIDYKDAETRGITKVDLLTNTAYTVFSSKQDYLDALSEEPDWDRLKDPEFLKHLPHIAAHGDIVNLIEPKTIQELADVLAMIRPAKRKFIREYRKNTAYVREQIYRAPESGMYFKKSHAISYAQMIVAVMNRIDAKRLIDF